MAFTRQYIKSHSPEMWGQFGFEADDSSWSASPARERGYLAAEKKLTLWLSNGGASLFAQSHPRFKWMWRCSIASSIASLFCMVAYAVLWWGEGGGQFFVEIFSGFKAWLLRYGIV